jgi:hypothetical protein
LWCRGFEAKGLLCIIFAFDIECTLNSVPMSEHDGSTFSMQVLRKNQYLPSTGNTSGTKYSRIIPVGQKEPKVEKGRRAVRTQNYSIVGY